VLAKASPRPSPDEKPTPKPNEESDTEEREEATDKSVPAEESHEAASDMPQQNAPSTGGANGSGSGGGVGRGKGMTKSSEFASYGKMLHDRFYSEWVQPTTTVASANKISTTVRVRIEKDGRVSNFEIIRPSGNVMVDESVAAMGQRVTEVDPLPASLRSGGHYDIKINFELNSD
jgi:TonB family protein